MKNNRRRQKLSAFINAETLPDLAQLHLEDILELKEKTSDYLAPFRTKLAEYSRTIRNEPWAPGFEKEVQVLFEQVVQPTILEAERALGSHKWKKFWGRVGGYGCGTASVVLASHFSNFNEFQTLLVLAGAIASALSFDISPVVAPGAFARENGMMFMLQAKKKLS